MRPPTATSSQFFFDISNNTVIARYTFFNKPTMYIRYDPEEKTQEWIPRLPRTAKYPSNIIVHRIDELVEV